MISPLALHDFLLYTNPGTQSRMQANYLFTLQPESQCIHKLFIPMPFILWLHWPQEDSPNTSTTGYVHIRPIDRYNIDPPSCSLHYSSCVLPSGFYYIPATSFTFANIIQHRVEMVAFPLRCILSQSPPQRIGNTANLSLIQTSIVNSLMPLAHPL